MSYYEQYPPITPVEDKITLLLVMEGYKKDDIHFRDELGKKSRHLRCAYWEYINTKTLKYVEEHADVSFNMEVIEDSDCLDKYCYNYKIKGDE